LIVGGGCHNKLLNQSLANATGKEVQAGPVDATAIGNILNQLIAIGEVKDLAEGRNMICNSFDIEKFVPSKSSGIC
jgi:rhamnulokinase